MVENLPRRPEEYEALLNRISKLKPEEMKSAYRYLCKHDLYFMAVFVMKRKDFLHQFLFDRCREVQANPDGYLDLWARDHRKSTLITCMLSIQDILKNPEITIGIFSHTAAMAKDFLKQIKRELEQNQMLIELFPDVLYDNPTRDSPKWSEDGIIVRRKNNPKECTVEAAGVVVGQPIGKHFDISVYDDIVTEEACSTPDQLYKTRHMWELSLNLGTRDAIRRYIGTRYHYNDLYAHIIDEEIAKPRIYPATKDGTPTGVPYFLTQEQLDEKLKGMGSDTFYKQMLQNPRADDDVVFKKEWLRYYLRPPEKNKMNIYITVDPASEKKQGSDFTCMWVVGAHEDGNLYILDCVYDKLRLKERADKLFDLHREWRPIDVAYERYGMMADIEYMKERMETEAYNFKITEVGGAMSKIDRIKRISPDFENSKIILPRQEIKKYNYAMKRVSIIEEFIREYESFPVGKHDDMLDSLSRIKDIRVYFPEVDLVEDDYTMDVSRNETTGY